MNSIILLFLKGLVLGLSIAAPVGPIGVLCIRITLTQGIWAGFFAGLGAATADAMYGLIAGFGITLISNFLIQQQTPLSIIGGLLLGYLGIKTFIAHPTQTIPQVNSVSLLSSYATTFALTLTNPMTILAFIAIFSGLGVANASDTYASAMALIGGIFVGSALWWFTLCGFIGFLRQQVTEKTLLMINRVSGMIIIVFALLILVSLLK